MNKIVQTDVSIGATHPARNGADGRPARSGDLPALWLPLDNAQRKLCCVPTAALEQPAPPPGRRPYEPPWAVLRRAHARERRRLRA